MTHIPSSIHEYKVLQIELPPLSSYSTKATHYMYIRQHSPKTSTQDDSRTLFVVNVPIDATELHFKSLFSRDELGAVKISEVLFEGARSRKNTVAPVKRAPVVQNKKRKRGQSAPELDMQELSRLPETWNRELRVSGSTATIQFVDRTSAELALKSIGRMAKRNATVVWGEGIDGKIDELGPKRYQIHQRLRYPDRANLRSSVDAFMSAFAANEEFQARESARLRSEPDEDGFVTVTRGGRVGAPTQEVAKAAAEKQKARQGDGLKDFYRFQGREERKKREEELKLAFQRDKVKLEEMRRKRNSFRPE